MCSKGKISVVILPEKAQIKQEMLTHIIATVIEQRRYTSADGSKIQMILIA